MRHTWVLPTIIIIACASSANAQSHRDSFDNYSLGPLAPQGSWEEWTGSTDVNGEVSNTFAFTGSQSCLIVGDIGGSTGNGDDVVWDYVNLPGGRPGEGLGGIDGLYTVSIMTYVPSTATGTSWAILMNRYPSNLNWSTQIELQADNGVIVVTEPGTGQAPLRVDEWVNILVTVDLQTDIQYIYYGGVLLNSGVWIDNGQSAIAAIDLYAGEPTSPGTTGCWYDNHRLEFIGQNLPSAALDFNPAKVTSGSLVDIKTQSPTLTNTPYALFATEILGNPFFALLFISALDGTGENTISANIPSGIPAGISIGLKSYVAVPSGGLTTSNTFELVFF